MYKHIRRATLAGAGFVALGAMTLGPTVAASAAPAPSTVYVAKGGSNSNSCASVALACGTVQHAIDTVAIGGTVDVEANNVAQTFLVNKPVTIDGVAGAAKTIFRGGDTDTSPGGGGPANAGANYYGIVGIDNLSGTPGKITIEGLTIENAFVTGTESSEFLVPTDVSNEDTVADTVTLSNDVLMGASEDIPGTSTPENTYGSVGYYQSNTPAAATISGTTAEGTFQGFFAEGTGSMTINKDTVTGATPLDYQGTNYVGEGVRGFSDAQGTQTVKVTDSAFKSYGGYGIFAEAGYSESTCTVSTCTGTEDLTATGNSFALAGGTGGFGPAAAIQATVDGPQDTLTGTISDNSGTVTTPTLAIGESDSGGTLNISEPSGNAIS